MVEQDAYSTKAKLLQFGDYHKGDLGGVLVKIPKKLPWFLAYDKGESKNGVPIISGFLIRTNYGYLMHGTGDRFKMGEFENEAEIYVDAGSRYSERYISHLASPCKTGIRLDRYNYEKSPELHDGLQWCFPTYDFKYHEGFADFNIYYTEDQEGNARQVINCPNKETVFMNCRQSFFLDPEMRVRIMVRYQKSHFKNWRQMEGRVRAIFREFVISNP